MAKGDMNEMGMAEASFLGKRALVLGAETALGQGLATALAEAGADVAAVAAAQDAEAALVAKRVARRLAALGRRSLAQAIDARNEMAVRVMIRQVSKELGGLDLLFFCATLGEGTPEAFALACRYGAREMARGGGGAIVALGLEDDLTEVAAQPGLPGVQVSVIPCSQLTETSESTIAEALRLALGRPPT